MRKALLSLFHSNRALKNFYGDKVASRDIRERRSKIAISVIDDEPFSPHANLSNYGYNISPIGDIKSVSEVESFDLILCDIMGVGNHFDKKLQGASLIAEIKRCHPEKIVIAYTGAALHQVAAKQATLVADDVIKKDVDIEDWIAALDRYNVQILDPYEVWQRIRFDFIQRGVDTSDVLLLEDAFVRSVERRDSQFLTLRMAPAKSGVKDDVRSIITGLISSVAFQYIVSN